MEKTLELGVNRRVSKLQMRKDQDVEGHMDAPYAGGGEEGNESWCPLVQCPPGP